MSTTIEEAPQGLDFDASAGDNLVNLQPADEFDARYKDDIDGLVWLGFLTDTFTMYGHTFVIQTLTRGERMAVTLAVKEYDESIGISMALETATVAASILMVDGRPVNPSFGPETQSPLTQVLANMEVVSKWFDPLIEALYQRYKQLQLRQIQAFFELEGK